MEFSAPGPGEDGQCAHAGGVTPFPWWDPAAPEILRRGTGWHRAVLRDQPVWGEEDTRR